MDETFITLKPDMSLTEAIDILMDNGLTGATVVDEENRVVGLLSEKDCLQTLLKGAYDQMPSGPVSEYMSAEVITVPPDTDIFKLAEMFMKRVYRRFPVVENGVMVGQVTRRDLLRTIQKFSG